MLFLRSCLLSFIFITPAGSLRSWQDFARECFCSGGEAVRGLVKSRVEFPSVYFRGFFLCVPQCTRISDWLRALKRQSNVNLCLSPFPGEKVCFANGECEEMHRGSFGFSEYPQGKKKNYVKRRTGEIRFRVHFGELMMCKMGLTSLQTRLLRYVTFLHLPFSVGSLDLFVASLVFMKGTSRCVIRRNLKQSRGVRSCHGKLYEVTGLQDFRCYLHVASLSLTSL